jgi:2-aminoadipate transaminase
MLAGGLRPKFLYTIPDFQNPTGLSLSAERREALIALARRYGFLILEDTAYRELPFGGEVAPSLWSAAPDVVLQAGTFSKIFSPGFRLGWAAGPPAIVSRLIVAKQNSDQCSGALGQRLLGAALAAHMPEGTTWTTPRGGFYYWVTAPAGTDTVALASQARARKVAYVPGVPFYPGQDGQAQIRLAYSRVADDLIDEGIRRIGEVLRTGREAQ